MAVRVSGVSGGRAKTAAESTSTHSSTRVSFSLSQTGHGGSAPDTSRTHTFADRVPWVNLETNRLSYVRATPFRTQSTARSRMTEGPSRRGTPCPRQCSMATISLAVYLRAYTPKSAACSAPPQEAHATRRVGKVSFHGAKRTFSRAQSSFSRTIRPPSCAPPSPNPSWPLCPPSPCPRPPVPAKRSRARQRLYAKHTIERARARAHVGTQNTHTRIGHVGAWHAKKYNRTCVRLCVGMLARKHTQVCVHL